MRWDLTPAADRASTPRSDEWCDRLVTDGRLKEAAEISNRIAGNDSEKGGPDYRFLAAAMLVEKATGGDSDERRAADPGGAPAPVAVVDVREGLAPVGRDGAGVVGVGPGLRAHEVEGRPVVHEVLPDLHAVAGVAQAALRDGVTDEDGVAEIEGARGRGAQE